MAILKERKKPEAPPAPLTLVPPKAMEPLVEKPEGKHHEMMQKTLEAQTATLEQMSKANDAFIAALRHEFAKQNYKSVTATVQRDSKGRIEKIHMEVERT